MCVSQAIRTLIYACWSALTVDDDDDYDDNAAAAAAVLFCFVLFCFVLWLLFEAPSHDLQ